MPNLKDQVKHCLEKYPEGRNSDINLTFIIIAEFYPQEIEVINGKYFYSGDVLKEVREDNVKRIRAAFNHKGLYLPTNPEVLKARGIAERVWHNEMSLESIEPIKIVR